MCLYPTMVLNPKYKQNKKNGGIIPAVPDPRVLYVPIGCQRCIECRKRKSREWQVRLLEDIKTNTNGKFVTLTFRQTGQYSLQTLYQCLKDQAIQENGHPFDMPDGYDLDNAIATQGVRYFLERWRKEFKKSLRHWLVTELGHKNTEHIHLHGIIWTDQLFSKLEEKWKYGYIYPTENHNRQYNYVNEKTVNYITKYVSKMDVLHQHYKPIILTSAGIGRNYTNTHNAKQNNIYKGDKTDETYRTNTGHKISMPIYYRNKIYNDHEKEQLWLNKLNREERYILGNRIDISKGQLEYYMALQIAQEQNTRLGYGGNELRDWKRATYEQQRRKLIHNTRLAGGQ